MFDLGSIVAHINADVTDFKEGVEDAKKQANGLGDTFKNLGSNIKNFANQAAIYSAAATTGIVAFGKASLDAYNESEAAAAQLVHAVRDVTHATNQELAATFQLSNELEKKGVLDADNINVGLAQLSTFGLSNKAVRGLGQSMADLAVNQYGVKASGDQLSESANLIAKALRNDFTMLQKSGIRFSDAQKHMIEFGTEMEKVKAINEGFAQNLKYTNDVALTTMEGKLAKVSVQFGNFQEKIGGVVNAILGAGLAGDRGGISADPISELFPDQATAQKITDIINTILRAFFDLSDWIKNNQELVITFLQGLAIAFGALMIIGTVTALVVALTNPLVLVTIAITALYTAWQTNFWGIRDVTQQVADFISFIFTTYIQPVLQQFTDWLTNTFYPAFNAVWNGLVIPTFQAFVGWFTEHWQAIVWMIDGAWKIITGIIQLAWNLISGIISVALELISGDFKGAWAAWQKMNQDGWDAITRIFRGAVEVVAGIVGSVYGKLIEPFQKAYDKIQEISNKIKDAVDPNKRHSPSMVDRVKKGINDLNDAFDGIQFNTSMTAHQAAMSVSGGTQSSMVNDINIDMSGAFIGNEATASQLGETIGDQIIKKLQLNVKY